MGYLSLICAFIFYLFYFPSLITAQQGYADNNCQNTTTALGYACNGVNRTCSAYLIYRTQPPYSTLFSIASLLSVDRIQVAAINNISSGNMILATNNELIIPVSCSCEGNFYQANTTYFVQEGDNYLLIANNTFEGLTTCNAIQNEKLSPNVAARFPNERLTIPLRCACPTKKQAGEGIQYLMSYVIQPGDNIASIAMKHSADVGQTLDANQKSEQDSLIYPFTTLLIPLQNPPIAWPIHFMVTRSRHTLTKPQIALLAIFPAIVATILIIIAVHFERKYSTIKQAIQLLQPTKKREFEVLLRNCGISGPQRYTYADLKRITNSFKDKLGEGGYGMVYKGKLHDGHMVAVKILKKSKGDPVEFINEVASIGRTNHKNIVKLLGFCYGGHQRALVYDLMHNGSLDKFIYDRNNQQSLAWEKLFQIAIGIARGLEYLHQGCNTRILHFDIKPHNILLDENFCPKISDFGLAKSCPKQESIISISEARGTVGYIAPEVFLRSFGAVSQKSDVYSYGMLVLEMIGCRKIADAEVESSTEQYFPHWIYRQLDKDELKHPESLSSEDRELQRKMVLVSLWCIQTSPQSRPTMTQVVDMLEGSSRSLQIPHMPTLASPPRFLSVQNTSTTGAVSIS